MRRRIHLHGIFKSFHDGPIEVVSRTVAEALDIVSRQIPGFRPNAIQGRKQVQIAGFNTERSLYADTDVEDIHIFPAMAFGKNGGILQTIIGFFEVIIGTVLLFVPGMQGFGISLIIGGAMMVIGGLINLLSPQPNTGPTHKSQYLAANGNTVAIGTPIPILYGERRVYGQILSLDVQSQDLPND